MKKVICRLVLGFWLSTTVLSFSSLVAEENRPGVNERMRELQQALEELYAYVIKARKIDDKPRIDEYGKSLHRFATLAESVAKSHQELRQVPGHNLDISLEKIGGLFAEQTKLAVKLFEKGEVADSRNQVLKIGQYCITCHTASNRGFNFIDATMGKYTTGMSTFERAEFLAATRRFDAAVNAYRQIIDDPVSAGSLEWVKAVQRGMMIAIRYKEQPELALQLVQRALSNPNIPIYFRRDATMWKKGIEAWMREDKKEIETDEQSFTALQKLFESAKTHREYPADQGTNIDFLRATAAAHAYMGHFPQGKHTAEVLYYLGTGYEALTDLSLWPLHQNYYEACIHSAAHQPIAQKCYESYEESLYAGYSGSGGTFIPVEESQKLKELKKIAQ
jgi:hypothetical protein